MQLRSGRKSIGKKNTTSRNLVRIDLTVQEMLRCEKIHLRESFGSDNIYRYLKRKIKKSEKELDQSMYSYVFLYLNFTAKNNSYLRYLFWPIRRVLSAGILSAVLTAAPFRRRGISKHKPITAEIK